MSNESETLPTVDRKARIKLLPQPVPKQPPHKRITNFDEVYLGYDQQTARLEAGRCIQCRRPAPCQRACPLSNDIAGALWLIENGDFVGAANRFRQTSNMPEVCGRVCPQERLCEGSCVVGKKNQPLTIGMLEAFAVDYQRRESGFPKRKRARSSGKKVAVVGSGPAGLAVAEELTVKGHSVTVYEACPRPGGILNYGIPRFKLPTEIVEAKIDYVKNLGVEFITETRVGEAITVEELLEGGFDAIFLGTGAGICARLDAPGEELAGIYHATDFLVRANLTPDYLPPEQREPLAIGRRVAVIGGGDTAMDCVRTAIRLEAEEVTCVYRRTEVEMPSRAVDRALAREEGVKFECLVVPVRFLDDGRGRVKSMECLRTELGEPDASGRRRPLPIEGSEFVMEVDSVVLALGYWPDPLLGETTPGLETRKWGLIVADGETGMTSLKGVFAAGDNVHGPDLVVTALAAARKAATAMDQYLRG